MASVYIILTGHDPGIHKERLTTRGAEAVPCCEPQGYRFTKLYIGDELQQ